MGDCQLVLRYFALKEEDNIRGSMKSMLDRAMERKVSETEADELAREFKERFTFLYELFNGSPFALPPDEKGRVRISAAIYDSSMVAIDDLWSNRDAIMADAANVRARMLVATVDAEMAATLTGQANTARAVKDRIALMRTILRPA